MGSNMTKRFKIEPDLTCPELAGYKLPPCSRCQEDGVEAMAKEEFNSIDKPIRSGIDCHSYKVGFAECYTKAREKYEFTEDDMKYIFECGRNYQNNAEVTFKVSIDHLRTQRTPIAIDVEMVEARSESFRINGCDSFTEVGCIKQVCTCYDFKPAKNPDGTVKGRWVYE